MSDAFPGAKVTRIEASEVLKPKGADPTRDEFLADPSRLVWAVGVRPEWIVEAYRANPPFRDNIWYALSRSVSKNGDFFLAQGWLALLGPVLSAAEVVQLYEQIRDQSRRCESEWRAEFEQAFPEHAACLPEPRPEPPPEYWERLLPPEGPAGDLRDAGEIPF